MKRKQNQRQALERNAHYTQKCLLHKNNKVIQNYRVYEGKRAKYTNQLRLDLKNAQRKNKQSRMDAIGAMK